MGLGVLSSSNMGDDNLVEMLLKFTMIRSAELLLITGFWVCLSKTAYIGFDLVVDGGSVMNEALSK